MEKLIALAESKDTETLFNAVLILGGGDLDNYATMARVAALSVIESRMGSEYVESLMDRLGM